MSTYFPLVQAHKRSLGEILSNDIRLVAPLFQRPYVWSETDNWEPLWRAILEVSARYLSGDTPRAYFLGAMVLSQVPTPTTQILAREIIDGQQRMTTLQILMAVAKRICTEHKLEHPARILERLTQNDLEDESDLRFKVWPTNVDRNAFRATMSGESHPGRMNSAADYFEKVITEWIRPEEIDAKERANALVNTLKQNMVFVVIDLDNDDDGQLIFETLNSLGSPLLPSDLVKNLLFRQAMVEGLDTEKLYAQHWETFEKEQGYWREQIAIGRRERTRLDVFLQYYVAYHLEDEPVVAHQFRDYRDALLKGHFGNTTDAIADFATHAHWFREFDEAKTGAAGSLRHVLRVNDLWTPVPLILGIFANVPPGPERDAMLRILESYFMRRTVCALGVKSYNRVAIDILSSLRRTSWSAEDLRAALLKLDGNSQLWPDDGWVQWRQRERAAYANIRGVAISYALSCVEVSLRSQKSELPWNPRTPLTVEHLMPQKWQEHWPLEELTEESTKRRNELLDRIGNLTVLTQKLNSAISNASWAKKRGHLKDHTVLLVNSALADLDTWDEEAIIARSEWIGQRFCQIWPR